LLAIYSVSSQQTFCQKYSAALRISNKALVETVVNATIAEIFKPSSGIRRYFDGTHPNQTINFGTNIPAQNNLRNKLVQFFGAALGCSDGTIPTYNGRSMEDAHKRLSIDYFSHAQFNRIVVSVLAGAGVEREDLATAARLLDS
jgi:hypothetical protein